MNILEDHVIILILEGKLTIVKTVSNPLEKNTDDPEIYSRCNCVTVSGNQVTDNYKVRRV